MKKNIDPDVPERRKIPLSQFELRKDEITGNQKLVGYAAVFDQLSEDLGGFREKIQRGAFAKTLGLDVRALVDHESSKVLGRTKNKTLLLEEDSHGLKATINPPDTQMARDTVMLVEGGYVDQMSFGFRTISDKWESKDGEDIRTLTEVELFDVSIVTYPAYTGTDIKVALRSLEAWKETKGDADGANTNDGGGEANLKPGADDVSMLKKRLSIRDKERIIDHG